MFYLPEMQGWTTNFATVPTAFWKPQPQPSDPDFGVQSNRFGFTITWVAGRDVVIDASPELTPPTWSPVVTNTTTGGASYFSDPQWANYPRRFYRLRSQ